MPTPLTDQMISAALARGGGRREDLIDGAEPDLHLRIGSQEAIWSVRVRSLDGRRTRIPLGAWPAIPVREARLFARSLKASFAHAAAEVEPDLSIGKLLDKYEARRLSQLRKGRVMGRALIAALAPVAHMDAQLVHRRELADAIDKIADRAPIQGNRSLAYVKAFFSWCVGRGYIERNPAQGIAKPTRERTRERTPSLEELHDIWAVAGELGYPFGHAVRLLILTAARRDEVGGLRCDEIELADGDTEAVWTLPPVRSKNGRAIRIPLPPVARIVLEDALKKRSVTGAFVFSTNGETAISGWSKAKMRLDREIAQRRAGRGAPEMEAWRFHDLRRSFATHACDVLQVDPAVADRCLNHVGASTTSTIARVYARNEMFQQRRDALRQWAQVFEKSAERAT